MSLSVIGVKREFEGVIYMNPRKTFKHHAKGFCGEDYNRSAVFTPLVNKELVNSIMGRISPVAQESLTAALHLQAELSSGRVSPDALAEATRTGNVMAAHFAARDWD